MRIAQIAPLHESVPPRLYGGTERVVSYLTEELVRQGHDVTLYASGDSQTAARLAAAWPRSLRLDRQHVDPLVPHVLMLERVQREAEQYDILHFHVDYLHFASSRNLPTPHLTTLHGRLDLPELTPLYHEFQDMPVVSISDAQRTPLPHAAWQGTVYHGLPTDLFRFHPQPAEYLAFIGRISPEKRVDRAIEIAQRSGLPLKIAAKVDVADRDYYEREIRDLIEQPGVELIGEIGGADKEAFLGHARALLFPIDWPEPFGLAMIEALACGTPVVAWERGSVPEVIDDGASGVIVRSIDEAVRAVGRMGTWGRRRCREVFEQRFSAARMVEDYVQIYEQLCRARSTPPRLTRPRFDLHSVRPRPPRLAYPPSEEDDPAASHGTLPNLHGRPAGDGHPAGNGHASGNGKATQGPGDELV